MKTLQIIFTLVLLATTLQLSAQSTAPMWDVKEPENTSKGSTAMGAFGEDVNFKQTATPNNEIIGGFYRKAKPMPAEYTGYAIQLTTSMEILDKNHPIFAEFGNLLVEENANPKYCYLINGFDTEEGAEKHLQNVIAARYPNAKVVKYKNGKRD